MFLDWINTFPRFFVYSIFFQSNIYVLLVQWYTVYMQYFVKMCFIGILNIFVPILSIPLRGTFFKINSQLKVDWIFGNEKYKWGKYIVFPSDSWAVSFQNILKNELNMRFYATHDSVLHISNKLSKHIKANMKKYFIASLTPNNNLRHANDMIYKWSSSMLEHINFKSYPYKRN